MFIKTRYINIFLSKKYDSLFKRIELLYEEIYPHDNIVEFIIFLTENQYKLLLDLQLFRHVYIIRGNSKLTICIGSTQNGVESLK